MMTARETNTLRQGLKHKLSNYSWYVNSYVLADVEGYCIVIETSKLDDLVKNIVPSVVKNTNVKLVLKNKH